MNWAVGQSSFSAGDLQTSLLLQKQWRRYYTHACTGLPLPEPPTHTKTHRLSSNFPFKGGKKSFQECPLLTSGPLSTCPFTTHSRYPPSLLLAAFLYFPPTLVLSQSRSTAHPAHKLTPGNPSVTLTALTQRIESQHQQQWERKKRGLEKNVGKQQTRGIGGASISYFTQSNSWLSAEGNP